MSSAVRVIRFDNVSHRYSNTPARRARGILSLWPKSSALHRPAQDADAPRNNPEVLRNVNLDFEQGSFHFITGVSGAGKSTLLKLIYLGLRPSAGQIFVSGQPVASLESDKRAALRRRIGVVFQDYRLLDHLTVEENVALPLRVAGFYNARKRSDILDLLTWVGLGDNLAAFPQTLSGGQKQRVALARAVITRPQIILADEPTGNLDDGIGMRLIHLFEELNRIGTTVVVATHSKSLIKKFPHPVLALSGGIASLQLPEQYLDKRAANTRPSMNDHLRSPQFGQKS